MTQVDVDEDALDRAMALSKAKTKKEAVDLAMRYYVEKQERASRIGRHLERARRWARWRTLSDCIALKRTRVPGRQPMPVRLRETDGAR